METSTLEIKMENLSYDSFCFMAKSIQIPAVKNKMIKV